MAVAKSTKTTKPLEEQENAEKQVPSNVSTKKAADKDNRTPEEIFNEEASKVPIPTSIGMNNLRQQINDIISNTSLHPECILEVLRSATTMVEHLAAEVANAEMTEYREQIQKLRKKHKLD